MRPNSSLASTTRIRGCWAPLLVGALILLIAATWTRSAVAQRGPRPLNVVLLILDDVRWDAVAAAGNGVVRTPRIDQLAKRASGATT